MEQFPNLKWINSGGNVGFSKANNLGAAIAQGEYLLFLNCDTLIFDQSIQNAMRFVKEHPEYVSIGGIQLDNNLSPLPYFHTLNDIRKTFYFLPSFGGKILDFLLPAEDFKNLETNNLVGAFLLLSKNNFQKAGGWDEDFFMYAEDAEFSYRLSKLGKLTYLPNVQFIHRVQNNEFRRTNESWGNRFSMQIQLSNFLWIRKSYGVLPLLLIYFNYLLFLPIFWLWKLFRNLLERKRLFKDTPNQQLLTRKIGILIAYLPKLILLTSPPFKILPKENI